MGATHKVNSGRGTLGSYADNDATPWPGSDAVPWHALSPLEVARTLETDTTAGLTDREAALLPGDLIELDAGNTVLADARLWTP